MLMFFFFIVVLNVIVIPNQEFRGTKCEFLSVMVGGLSFYKRVGPTLLRSALNLRPTSVYRIPLTVSLPPTSRLHSTFCKITCSHTYFRHWAYQLTCNGNAAVFQNEISVIKGTRNPGYMIY